MTQVILSYKLKVRVRYS